MKGSHSWLMVLCVVGMGAFLILPALGIGLGSVLPYLLILLCPLSHFLMMRGGHGHESDPARMERPPTAEPRALPGAERQPDA